MRRMTAIVLGTCILLSGCAPSAEDRYATEIAGSFQSSVMAVTEASAAGDPQSALARLDELQDSLLTAFDAGSVPQSRFDDMTAAIALVRADLELAVIQSAEVVTDDDDDDDAPDKPGNSDKPDKPEKPDKDD